MFKSSQTLTTLQLYVAFVADTDECGAGAYFSVIKISSFNGFWSWLILLNDYQLDCSIGKSIGVDIRYFNINRPSSTSRKSCNIHV